MDTPTSSQGSSPFCDAFCSACSFHLLAPMTVSANPQESPVGSFGLVQHPRCLVLAIGRKIRHHERLLCLCHGIWRSKRLLLVFGGNVIRAILLFIPLLLHQLLQVLLLHLLELQRRRNRHVLLCHERRRLFRDYLGDGEILLRIIVVAGGRGMRVIRLLGQKILVVRNRHADGRLVGVFRNRVFGRWSRHGPRWMRAMLVFGQGGFATEANRALS